MTKVHANKIENSKTTEIQDKKLGFLGLADSLLLGLNERSREIIRRRFGLSSDNSETLEKIGRHYNITRERVRQIISEALKNISSEGNRENFLLAEEKIFFTIEQNGGIIKETDVVEKFNSLEAREANAIRFFVSCSKKIIKAEEKGFMEKVWVISKEILEGAKKAISEAEKIIQKEKKLFVDDEISGKLAPVSGLSHAQIHNFLKASSRVKKNKFGKWGIIDWMEISPKGTREKVHLILKEKKKPLHFTEIAVLIDEFQLGKRKAHPQTVHNELIKDDRFVLIGRGIYALKEWGYFEGTIREIIKMILEKNARPMTKEEVMKEILKMRHVKKTTIMINLNNKKYFEKKGELYTIKK